MKSRQFCSVCKEWLEMEVVPTGDGEDDDGVIWFRCPQCQGFLPKLSGADLKDESASGDGPAPVSGAEKPSATRAPDRSAPDHQKAPEASDDDGLAWDSPADMMAARNGEAGLAADDVLVDDVDLVDAEEGTAEAAEGPRETGEGDEPIHEYEALLESADQSDPKAYRPWEEYGIGDCIYHLAWDDCGVVLAKEDLPGGRKVIKVFFKAAGVVRLIEKAPR